MFEKSERKEKVMEHPQTAPHIKIPLSVVTTLEIHVESREVDGQLREFVTEWELENAIEALKKLRAMHKIKKRF